MADLDDLLRRTGLDVSSFASKLRELVKLTDTIGVTDEVVPLDLGVPQLTPGTNHWQRSSAIYWVISAPGEEQSITFSLDDFLPRGSKITGAKLSYATNASYVTGDVQLELIAHDSIGTATTSTQSSVSIVPSTSSLTPMRTALAINTRLLMSDGKETMLRVRYTVARAASEFRIHGLTVTYTYTNRPQPFPLTRLVAIAGLLAAGSQPCARLQPTLYSPVAQWALRGAPTTAVTYADRSGNGLNLTGGTPIPCPDLACGETCITNRPPAPISPGLLTVTSAALRIGGALTVTARVWVKTTGATQVLCEQGGASAASADNAQFVIYIDGSRNLGLFWETGASVDNSVTSTLPLPQGQWAFLSVRRDSAGALRFGVNDTYQDQAGGLPTGGSTSFFTLMDDDGGRSPWQGGVADFCVWNTMLTDVQLAPLYEAAMGLG